MAKSKGTSTPSVPTVDKSSRRIALILSKHSEGERKAVVKAANLMLRIAKKLVK